MGAPVAALYGFLKVTGSCPSQTCFGSGTMACEVVPARFSRTNRGLGAVSVNLIVRSSTTSAVWTHRWTAPDQLSWGAYCLSMLMVKTTSSDVSGRPSLHSVPGRSVTNHSVISRLLL
jgi:hypothetical protein